MHKQYAGAGLVAVSVSLDDVSDPDDAKDVEAKVLKFLQVKKATFTNLILEQRPKFWQEKLHIDGPPSVFVFNREGGLEKQFKDEFSYEKDVNPLVTELMHKK